MSIRKRVWILFSLIIIVAALAGYVDYPKAPPLKLGSLEKSFDLKLGLDLKGGVSLIYDADTSKINAAEKASALEGVRDVIERRINAFGVAEPVIQTQKSGDQWRVIVELPGVTDINEAIKRIGETPLLEFREEKSLTADEITAVEQRNAEVQKKAEEVLKLVKLPDSDFAALAKQYSEDTGSALNGGDLDYVARGQFVPEFDQAIFDELKVGEISPALVKSQFGYHIIKKTDERTENVNGEDVSQVRSSHILLKTESTNSAGYQPTDLTGKQLKHAAVAFDPNTNQPQISLEFNDEGTALFKAITERNVGKIVAIYLDGSPISLPTVQQAITSGQAVITGEFTLKDAKQLAQRLNSGALPVPVSLVSQQNIGATLGESSVQKSFTAGWVGLVLVAGFMLVYYRLPGLLAVSALGFYTLVIIAIFKLWPVTLTLAGIAGFILSIGMAVDANILIFERLKEELRAGRPLNLAIEEGFGRAWLSIRDSNVSSLITCFILAWFGTSIIKGFAVTLAIGIIISMLSAIVVTRTLMRLVQQSIIKGEGWLWLKSHKTK